jgi:hypothetical protein
MPWSSYAGNGGGIWVDPLLTSHSDYLALAADPEARRAAYRGLFGEAIEPSLLRSIRDATNGGYPLVSDAFKSGALAYRTERGKPGPRTEEPWAPYRCEPA